MTSPAEEALARAEALQARLDEVRRALEQTEDPDRAIQALTELAEIAKEIQAELERARREAESAG